MTTRNDITGDSLRSKATTDKYRDNYDKIFYRTSTEEVDSGTDSRDNLRVYNESTSK